MFDIIFHVEHDIELVSQRMNERIDWSVADTRKCARLAIKQQLRTNRGRAFRVAAHLVAFEFEF